MMKKYGSYKASNLSGVGDIPEHWGVRKLKYEASFNDEVLSDKTDDDYEIEYVEISNVQATKGITNTEIMPFKDAPSRARRLVRHGDVIVSTVRTYLRAIAKIENPPANMVVSTGFAVIRPKGIEYRFAGYLFTSEYIIDEIISKSVGVSYPAINASDLVNIKVVLPSHNEQVSIANFLDDKTSQIDSLIQKKQQMIALLEEEKIAVINEAVTKGLNPDVPMKDSGIEWIGNIPAHWEIKKIKYLGEAIIGVTYNPNEVTDETNGILVLRSSNIQKGKLAFEDCVYIEKEIPEKLITKVGDILICARNGSASLVGKNACIDEKSAGHTFGAFMTILRAKNYRFLSCFLNSSIFKSQIGSFSTSTINQLTSSILNNLEVPIPLNENEQDAIADFIQSKTSKTEKSIQKLEAEINLLQEYRIALISEAVTGKIDVRDYQPEPTTSTALT